MYKKSIAKEAVFMNINEDLLGDPFIVGNHIP